MNRDQVAERLRAWAARAQREALEADTHENILHWQAQAQVLSSIANFLADQGGESSNEQIWTRVVADRSKSLAAWLSQPEGDEAAYYAGEVAGYDVALTALRDLAGKVWPRVEPHVG
jgi:hypothetical protein